MSLILHFHKGDPSPVRRKELEKLIVSHATDGKRGEAEIREVGEQQCPCHLSFKVPELRKGVH